MYNGKPKIVKFDYKKKIEVDSFKNFQDDHFYEDTEARKARKAFQSYVNKVTNSYFLLPYF